MEHTDTNPEVDKLQANRDALVEALEDIKLSTDFTITGIEREIKRMQPRPNSGKKGCLRRIRIIQQKVNNALAKAKETL